MTISFDIAFALYDPTASNWFRDALAKSLALDPIDAANEAARLASLLEARASEALFGAEAPEGSGREDTT